MGRVTSWSDFAAALNQRPPEPAKVTLRTMREAVEAERVERRAPVQLRSLGYEVTVHQPAA